MNVKQQDQQLRSQNRYEAPTPSQQPEAKDPGNVTLFRTGNFFVHAFTPLQKTGWLQNASGNATILERIRWTSAEKQRLLAAQTRLLPQIDTFDNAQWQEIPIPHWFEAIVVAFIIGITMVLQALNIFNAPAYSVDEGNSMSNAWAILHGMITPYAYTYNHPPLGWIQIAAWVRLTGGLSSFGNAINSGRILMLLLAGASSLLLYLIASHLSGSRSAALLAVLIYTLSPLSLHYRREVLLDNIGIFWLLLSLSLITAGKSKQRTFVMGAIALGIAILPLLPFFALNIAMALNTPLRWVTRKTGFDLGRAMLIFIVIGVLLTAGLQQATSLQAKNAAEPQRRRCSGCVIMSRAMQPL